MFPSFAMSGSAFWLWCAFGFFGAPPRVFARSHNPEVERPFPCDSGRASLDAAFATLLHTSLADYYSQRYLS